MLSFLGRNKNDSNSRPSISRIAETRYQSKALITVIERSRRERVNRTSDQKLPKTWNNYKDLWEVNEKKRCNNFVEMWGELPKSFYRKKILKLSSRFLNEANTPATNFNFFRISLLITVFFVISKLQGPGIRVTRNATYSLNYAYLSKARVFWVVFWKFGSVRNC